MEQCILALEGGEPGAVDALLRGHPEQEPLVRERLVQLSALGILHAPPSPKIPERLGEFHLLRQIGRGGMGVVYLAEQPALQRQVALKLVHPEQLFFAGARERFRREVLAIARLSHPGIVPILTGGEAEGIPFYAMELVHGSSLAEVLQELAGTAPTALDGRTLGKALQRVMAKKHELVAVQPAPVFQGAWPVVCARLVLAAAQALHHAHEQGVLHRDLKPSNLLLTATGEVRLIDFGLAAAEGESRLTRSGATFGSLPYMAPEQVRGDTARIDRRTDVYQLGVTLYELLTLTLPHGDGSGDTRERIAAGSPSSPQRHNPEVHDDLAAVCLMAMDLDRARRYPDAGAFAADLRAFLEQRSVRARTPSRLLRLRRWAKRHPARAASAALLLFVLGPAPLGFAWQQHAANLRIAEALRDADLQRQAAVHHLGEANKQRALAEHNLLEALDSADLMLARTAAVRLVRTPGTARLRRQLLTDALEFYRRLQANAGDGSGDSDRLRFVKARAATRLGSMHGDLGELDAARPLLEDAHASLQQLCAAHANDTPVVYRQELCTCAEQLAQVYARTGKGDDYERCQQEAADGLAALAAATGESHHLEAALRTQLGLARAKARRRKLPEAFAALDALDQRLATEDPAVQAIPTTTRTVLWAEVAEGRGVLLAGSGDVAAATEAFEAAATRLATLPGSARDDDEVATTWATVHERLGMILLQRRDFERAAAPLDRACQALERLATVEPEYPTWRLRLAKALGARASNHRALGDRRSARSDHDRAVDALAALVAASRDDLELHRAFAIALAERGDAAAADGDLTTASADHTRAIAELERLLVVEPDHPQTRANLVAVLANHGERLAAGGDLAGAMAAVERSLALADPGEAPQAVASRCEILTQASDLAMRRGEPAQARTYVERAATDGRALLARRDDATAREVLLQVELQRGQVLSAVDGVTSAIRIWRDVLPLAEPLQSTHGRRLHALLRLRLAAVLPSDQRDEARAHFAAAMALGARKEQFVTIPTVHALFTAEAFADLLPQTTGDR
ncbi:MAG: serine/threonine protein kinase [Planctomycetes bacterium]|nr:serine/threonine protein kinase [Planctomycetota bacterium]